MKTAKFIIPLFLIAGLLLTQGCESAQPVQRIPFPVDEYAKLPKKCTGSAIVYGQVFLKTMIGEVRYGAGQEVSLLPVTTYSTQAFELRGNWSVDNLHPFPKTQPESPDQRIWEYTDKVQADGEGRFEFTKVPAGEYYVWSAVIWYIPAGQYGYPKIQGGNITKKITVKDEEKVRVILTR